MFYILFLPLRATTFDIAMVGRARTYRKQYRKEAMHHWHTRNEAMGLRVITKLE